MTDPCAFCEIIAGRAPATIEYEWDDAVAFLPREDKQGRRGCAPGHVLFVPRVHVVDAADQPAVTGSVAARAAEYASATGQPFNLITSAGLAATQTVGHLHWHFVPRVVGDGLALPWTGDAKVADELVGMLVEAFPDEDSDYHYGMERLLDLVRDRAAELRGGAQ